MKSNVWSALWISQFDPDEYLYHYTTFETAIKILYSDKFRFSPLSRSFPNGNDQELTGLSLKESLTAEQSAKLQSMIPENLPTLKAV